MSTLAEAGRNAACDAVVDLLDDASGVADPALLLVLTVGSVEIAKLTMATQASGAFGAAAVGVATAHAITKDSDADGGNSESGKVELQDGSGSVIITLTVGGSGSLKEIKLNTTSAVIPAHAEVSCSSLTWTQPAS